MKGKQAWDYSAFHATCRTNGYVSLIDFAGFKYVWCIRCAVLCNLDAIAVKFEQYTAAMASLPEEVSRGDVSPDNG